MGEWSDARIVLRLRGLRPTDPSKLPANILGRGSFTAIPIATVRYAPTIMQSGLSTSTKPARF
jgi:hypothetical protein